MAEGDDSEKTEDATPERQRHAREEGQFARSKDIGPVAATAAVLLLVGSSAGDFCATMQAFCVRCFQEPLSLVRGDLGLVARDALLVLAISCLPVALAAAIAGAAVGFVEAGFAPNFELIEPKFERLEPLGKLQQMFSPKAGLTNTAISLLRVVVVGAVVESIMEKEFVSLTRLSRAPLAAATWQIASVVMRVVGWSTGALAVIAAIDYGVSWWRHTQSIKMSRQ
jgi:flagellar biosynthetic protein FlhB